LETSRAVAPTERGPVCTSEDVCDGCQVSRASGFHYPHSSWWQQARAVFLLPFSYRLVPAPVAGRAKHMSVILRAVKIKFHLKS